MTSNIIKLEYLVILKRNNLEYIAWWNHSSFGGKFAINGYNFLLISFVCYISQTRCYWSSFRWIYTKGGFKTNTSNTLKEKRLYLRWSKCQFKQLVRGVVVWLSSCGLVCLYTAKCNLMQVFWGWLNLQIFLWSSNYLFQTLWLF